MGTILTYTMVYELPDLLESPNIWFFFFSPPCTWVCDVLLRNVTFEPIAEYQKPTDDDSDDYKVSGSPRAWRLNVRLNVFMYEFSISYLSDCRHLLIFS